MKQSQANQITTTSSKDAMTIPDIVRDTVPCGIRWLVKKDGTKVLQAGYKATKSFTEAWTVWEDVEEVKEGQIQ